MDKENFFLRFWEAYPRKVAIKDAQREFIDAVEGRGYSPHFLIDKAVAFAENVDPKRLEYVPHPATWLRDDRFEDHDLFTDQASAKRQFWTRCWRSANVKAIYDEYGEVYPKPAPPDGLADEELRQWDRDQKRTWIALKAKKYLGDSARA